MNHKPEKLDQVLDQQLSATDRALIPEFRQVEGNSIRRRAERKLAASRQRRSAMGGAVLAVTLLVGWRFLMPEISPFSAEQVAENIAEPTTEPTTEQLIAELEQIRQQQEALVVKSKMLELSTRLKRMSLQLDQLANIGPPTEVIYQRNRDAWSALQNVVKHPAGSQSILESNRWQMELLADSFSDTRAGAVARDILKTKQIPSFLN